MIRRLALLSASAVLLIGATSAAVDPSAQTMRAHLKSFLPWVNTATLLGMAGLIFRFWTENRRLRMAENKDDREGYGVLIAALQGDVKNVRDALAVEQEAHRTCEMRLNKIEGELMGFHRQALIQSQHGVAQLPASMMVKDAGERAVAAAGEAEE